jgi:hypothetical protein
MDRGKMRKKNLGVGITLAAIVLLYIGALVAYMVIR